MGKGIWRIEVYEKHIGIVDESGCQILNVVGGLWDDRAWDVACRVVNSINKTGVRNYEHN